jgi:type III secretion protein J
MRSPSRAFIAAALCGLLAGCATEIEHELSESEANDILVLLDENGISAHKDAEQGGREVTWKVVVARQDAARAVRVLKENELPRQKTTGFEIFDQGSLIPTATEERAKLLQSISGELSRTLRSIDGVLIARVHINIPEQSDLGDVKERPLPTASVLIKYRSNTAGDRPSNAPPLAKREVQELVARAIQDLKPEAVAVIEVPASLPGAGGVVETDYVDILGLRMSKDSAGTFKAMMFVIVLFVILCVGYIIWLHARGLKEVAPKRAPRTAD